jgi:glycosyltransferase involved in cell wall biosynthesis
LSPARVSVVVPAWNEGRYLSKLLESLEKQSFRDFEVVVADSGSEDDTAEVAARFGARVAQGPRKGAGEGRNRGARAATGDILVFIDSDCVAHERLLEDVVKTCGDSEVIGGTFAFLPLDGTRLDRILYAFGNVYEKASIALGFYHNSGYGFFYRRKVYEDLGGIREEVVFNETHDLAMRSRGKGKFVYISTPVYTSMRRYRKHGYVQTIVKMYIWSTLYYYLTRQSPRDRFEYKPAR